MGRSEAPLPSDRDGEESLEEPTENNKNELVEDRSLQKLQETMGAFLAERLCGVEFKYDEQDSYHRSNSIQTTLSVNPPN